MFGKTKMYKMKLQICFAISYIISLQERKQINKPKPDNRTKQINITITTITTSIQIALTHQTKERNQKEERQKKKKLETKEIREVGRKERKEKMS